MSEHKTLAEALVAFQGAAPKLHKGGEAKAGAYSYKYVDLKDLVETIRPLMLEHGLAFSAFPCLEEGRPALRYMLTHSSGDMTSDVMPLLLSKSDAQGMGSAITYARRYALTAVLNLVADADDDGQAASEPTATQKDVEEMSAAAKGLSASQIKLALSTCGVSAPEKITADTLYHVPKSKVGALARALSGAKR